MSHEVPVFSSSVMPSKFTPQFYSHYAFRLPVGVQNASYFTLFFQSLYYFGNEQFTLYRDSQAKPFIHREVTPFLKSKLCFFPWITLKVLVQASVLWNWRVWVPLNAIGLYFEYKKLRLQREYPQFSLFSLTRPPPISLPANPPVAFQNYLTCPQAADEQRQFFKDLSSEQQQDFCRFFAQSHPDEITALLDFDFNHKIFEENFYKQLLKALVHRNVDAFLCFYPILHKYTKNTAHFYQTQRLRVLYQAILNSLSVSSISEKQRDTPTPLPDFTLTENHIPALPLIFRYLANNDRARTGRCCRLFYRILHSPQVPSIQRFIGEKLLWVKDCGGGPVDYLSKGQIDFLFKTAHQRGVLRDVVEGLLAPAEDSGVWIHASQLYLSLRPERPRYELSSINSYDLVTCYEVYSDWQQGKIAENQKKSFFLNYLHFILMSHVYGVPIDPLARWILEKGSPADKQLVCSVYIDKMSSSVFFDGYSKKSFLLLAKHYLRQSPEAFKIYFLTNFLPFMKERVAQLDKKKWEETWEQLDDPKPPLPDYLFQKASHSVYAEELPSWIFQELQKDFLYTTAELIRDCLLSYIKF